MPTEPLPNVSTGIWNERKWPKYKLSAGLISHMTMSADSTDHQNDGHTSSADSHVGLCVVGLI